MWGYTLGSLESLSVISSLGKCGNIQLQLFCTYIQFSKLYLTAKQKLLISYRSVQHFLEETSKLSSSFNDKVSSSLICQVFSIWLTINYGLWQKQCIFHLTTTVDYMLLNPGDNASIMSYWSQPRWQHTAQPSHSNLHENRLPRLLSTSIYQSAHINKSEWQHVHLNSFQRKNNF